MERISSKKQQRVGCHLREFCQPCYGAHPQILRRTCPPVGQPSATATAVLEKMSAFPEKIGTAITHYRFREASQELMNLARWGISIWLMKSRGKK